MKTIKDIPLRGEEKRAIESAARLLKERYSALEVILFGSKARGDDDEESDLDLLVLTSHAISWVERKAIIDSLFEIESTYDVVISVLVVTADEWKEGPFSILPIADEIREYGAVA